MTASIVPLAYKKEKYQKIIFYNVRSDFIRF